MRRYGARWRQQVLGVADTSIFTLHSWLPVAPGTTLNGLSAPLRVSSALTTKWYQAPMMLQAFSFYVPYRLVWDQWADFIGEAEGAPTSVPLMTGAVPSWARGGTSASVLNLAAFRLAYNQYFGQRIEGRTDTWYADLLGDDYDGKLVRRWDQYMASVTTEDIADTELAIPVAGANATMSLREFSLAMRKYHMSKNQSLTGDKYVDTMRACGVDLDWRLQNAPEFLGQTSHIVRPTTIQSTGDDLKLRNSRYTASFTHSLKKRRSFAEHGVVVTAICARPAMYARFDLLNEQVEKMDFFSPDTLYEFDEKPLPVPRLAPYRSGRNVADTAATQGVVAGYQQVGNVYPTNSPDFDLTEFGGSQLVWESDVTASLITPVPPNRT